jgi:hypothetical protein
VLLCILCGKKTVVENFMIHNLEFFIRNYYLNKLFRLTAVRMDVTYCYKFTLKLLTTKSMKASQRAQCFFPLRNSVPSAVNKNCGRKNRGGKLHYS